MYITDSPVRRAVRQHHRLAVVLLVRRLCLVPLAPAVGLRPRLGLTRHVASTQHLVPINCLLGTHTPRGKPRVPPLKRSKRGCGVGDAGWWWGNRCLGQLFGEVAGPGGVGKRKRHNNAHHNLLVGRKAGARHPAPPRRKNVAVLAEVGLCGLPLLYTKKSAQNRAAHPQQPQVPSGAAAFRSQSMGAYCGVRGLA